MREQRSVEARFHLLDLFSGIGGFSLGLERVGFKTVAFCEIERYCRAVLKKHWPDVPCYSDVRELNADRLARDGIVADFICGGFPCQDISLAGDGAGLAGKRSGLWSEFHRLIEELQPKGALIENVSALRSRGLEVVLGQLAAIGYDAEWYCIPASAVGAPHQRDRVWIFAYANLAGQHQRCKPDGDPPQPRLEASLRNDLGRLRPPLADTHNQGLSERQGNARLDSRETGTDEGETTAVCGWWSSEPALGRVVNGLPSRVDRIKCLGNAVVPQIPEIFGRAIVRAMP